MNFKKLNESLIIYAFFLIFSLKMHVIVIFLILLMLMSIIVIILSILLEDFVQEKVVGLILLNLI